MANQGVSSRLGMGSTCLDPLLKLSVPPKGCPIKGDIRVVSSARSNGESSCIVSLCCDATMKRAPVPKPMKSRRGRLKDHPREVGRRIEENGRSDTARATFIGCAARHLATRKLIAVIALLGRWRCCTQRQRTSCHKITAICT